MCVYILSHADVKYLFYQLGSRCTVPSPDAAVLLSRTKAWITNGKWEFTSTHAVPAVVRALGRWSKNVEFAMGNGRWETGNYGSCCTVPGCGTGLCRMVCRRWLKSTGYGKVANGTGVDGS